MASNKVSMFEKISFGSGDLGCTIIWNVVGMFLTIYYTDGSTNTEFMTGTIRADGTVVTFTAVSANAMTITCNSQSVILEDTTIDQPVTISAANVVLNGTTSFGTESPTKVTLEPSGAFSTERNRSASASTAPPTPTPSPRSIWSRKSLQNGKRAVRSSAR